MSVTTVSVYATDPLTIQGAAARLSSDPGIEVVDAEEGRPYQVLLVLADEVTDGVLAAMRKAHPDGGDTSVVLVARAIQEHQVLRAVKSGLVSLLYRPDTTFDRIVEAIKSARAGRAQPPGAVTRYVVDQLRAMRSGGTPANGLASREVKVLKLFADGMDTTEVASRLNYSERTVKNITHGIVTRLKLRNRTHAVAFALRLGVL